MYVEGRRRVETEFFAYPEPGIGKFEKGLDTAFG
jgi:hypothetical protein